MGDDFTDGPTQLRPPEDTETIVIGEGSEPDRIQLTPGTVLGKRYRIVSLLGQGGMGVVYRADDLKLGQPIAIKIISLRGADESRLYQEVRLGRSVSHPNVCRLHDIVELDGRLFITMEYIDGEDLASLLRRVGRMPSEKAIAMGREICSGLAAAHSAGVIHRDLKPANVLIDGRGRARISDFGLAVAEETGGDGIVAGTPAYMAPEQLGGAPASVQSDIYAAGLVLYETMTGHHPFEGARSTRELLTRQRNADYQRPAAIVSEIEPRVEQIINRCLDPDPSRRPQSVDQVLRELPGRDALSAAVAAGETPSPEMVAAAAERGDLRPRTAITLLLLAILALATYALLTSRSMLYGRIPELKPPEVLEEKAREILTAAGAAPRTDWDYFYYAEDERARPQDGARRAHEDVLRFAYRQSPRVMASGNLEQRITRSDPPLTSSGMSEVVLDASGRLVEFTIVPPQIAPSPAISAAVDWKPLLIAAGLSPALAPAAPSWASPVDSDSKMAWKADDRGTRVEAASFRGRPVWFAVIRPWTEPARMREKPQTLPARIALGMAVAFLIAIPTTAIFLARRNIRRNRVDHRGATRFAVAMFLVVCAARLLRAHHVSDVVLEWLLLSRIVVDATFAALVAGIVHVAIEPLVRRRWPRMLIGWSRLFEGRFRDPMVGRDVLIGVLAGSAVAIVWQMTAMTPGATPLVMAATPFNSVSQALYFIVASVTGAMLRAIGLATLVLLLAAILRKPRVVSLVACVLLALSLLNDPAGSLLVQLTYAVIAAAGGLALLYRFGLLATMVYAYTFLVLRTLPITLDTSAWYFDRSLLGLSILVALAIFSFTTSLGGKRWLPELDV